MHALHGVSTTAITVLQKTAQSARGAVKVDMFIQNAQLKIKSDVLIAMALTKLQRRSVLSIQKPLKVFYLKLQPNLHTISKLLQLRSKHNLIMQLVQIFSGQQLSTQRIKMNFYRPYLNLAKYLLIIIQAS